MNHLDELLDLWGTAQRVDTEHAERIRDLIVGDQPLDPQWWTNFNSRFTRQVKNSVQPILSQVA